METLHISFREMFDERKTGIQRVVIPKIQRAFAQGRTDARTTRTRTKFLDAIFRAVNDESPLTLDFIYGNSESGTLIPLDGQQRLTTLFLLYWYASRDFQGVPDIDCSFLNNFTYETRYSARDFCNQLIKYTPERNGLLSEEITDQAWFPLDWRNDATIDSMLVMLDAIDQRFAKITNLWHKLDDVKFYFLPIDKMGLTDDIYIKMNSRGKPLTDFEHFKAEFEKALKSVDADVATRVIRKIDVDWTDMLWPYKGEDNIIDDEFLRYFRFVCDILCYRNGNSPKTTDEFVLIDEYFRGPQTGDNIVTLEKFFDCWNGLTPDSLFDDFISTDAHMRGKILLRRSNQKYLFRNCLEDFGEVQSNGNRKFTLNQTILLYAFSVYRMNETEISKEQFSRRLRIVYNLILNSTDEISDSEARTGGNRLPAILKQVDSIITTGRILDIVTMDGDDSPRPNFNVNQLQEEREKLVFTTENPQFAEALFTLEDHSILRGQIDIVGLEHPERFDRFAILFQCNWDSIDCAMLSICDSSRRDRPRRIEVGSYGNEEAWRELFNKSSKAAGYDNVKRALHEILDHQTIDNNLLSEIIHRFISNCEEEKRYPWRYYYVKYPGMRIGRYGKYAQPDDKPYQLVAIYARQYESSNAYSVFLNELGDVDADHWGQRITINDAGDYVWCENSSYILCDVNKNELNRLPIPQEDGIDTEDRVVFGREHWNELSCLNDKESEVEAVS